MICAWLTSEGDIMFSLTRLKRTDCSGQTFQREEQKKISEEELFPLVDQFVYFQRFKFIRKVSQQARIIFSEIVLVPKLQPGVQMDLNSSELPEELRKIVKEDTVKKKMYYKKNAVIPAN